MLTGLGAIENVRIDNWRANSRHTDAFVARAAGANITALNIGQGRASGASGAGLKLVADEGRTISAVVIGDDADIYGRATPVSRSGAGTIAKPTFMPQNGPARLAALGLQRQVTLPNDSVYTIDFGANVVNGSIEIATNQTQTPKGKWVFRSGLSPFCDPISIVIHPDKVAYSSATLTGTTGAVGMMTLSVTSGGKIHIENRLGVGDVSFLIVVHQGIANFEFS